jgi:hypothetical protein
MAHEPPLSDVRIKKAFGAHRAGLLTREEAYTIAYGEEMYRDLCGTCVTCGGPLEFPLERRSHKQYCSSACRQKAYRQRRGTGAERTWGSAA